MGEQFVDLFTAGAYALVGRIDAALANPSLAWLFYLLAAAGLIAAMLQSAIAGQPIIWLRHLACLALASVLTLMPQRVDLTTLDYGAPGEVERLFGTRTGAAPHLTYWIERLGANATVNLRALTHQGPTFVVPGVAAQVDAITHDAALLDEPQLKANEIIWRQDLVPQILHDDPALAQRIAAGGLLPALLAPAPDAPQLIGTRPAAQAQAVQAALAGAGIDLGALLRAQAPLINQVTSDAGAQPWTIPAAPGTPAQIAFSLRSAGAIPGLPWRLANAPAYDDAIRHADALTATLRAQLPQADSAAPVSRIEDLYDRIGRSVFYDAAAGIAADGQAKAAIGSLCQRTSDANCALSMAPLLDTAARLRMPARDRYTTGNRTTWLEQPITTILLTIASVMLGTLATLVVAVLPFTLGVAKTIAILVSTIGCWMLLWPGRARVAVAWMVGPISFVSLWSVLFDLWADIEPALSQIGSLVGGAPHGSWSAGRAMSIAISLGYMGLPTLALGIVYGEGRALYHASARMETALMTAWHARAAIISFSRHWIVNSPLGRRWNQRVYRAVGLGPLAASRGGARTSPKASPPKTTARKPGNKTPGAARTPRPRKNPESS